MSDDPRLGIGGNDPPEPTPIERAEQLIPVVDAEVQKGVPKDAGEAGVLGELLVQIRKAKAALVDERDAAKKPYADALLLLDYRYKGPIQKLDMAAERIAGSKKVAGLLPAFAKIEQDRLAAEAEAKRREAEEILREAERASDRAIVSGTIDDAITAEQAAKAAGVAEDEARHAPVKARVRGDLAPRAVAFVTRWSAEIIDWPAARKHYRQNARVVKAYDAAVAAAADDDARRLKDAAKAPPGVKFNSRQTAQ